MSALNVPLMLVVIFLASCAGTFKGECAILPLGQTDGGIVVVKAYCEAE